VKVKTTNDQGNGEIVRIGLPNRFRVGVDTGNTLTDAEV